MKWKITILFLAGALIFFVTANPKTPTRTDAQQPVVFFTKGVVQRFDGTPRGTYSLMRLTGMNGTPETVFEDGGTSYLPAPVVRQRYIITRPHNKTPVGESAGLPFFQIGILPDGRREVVGSEPMVDLVDLRSKVVSPDDRYLVTTEVLCLEEVQDGPCPSTFLVKVYDYKTGKILTFDKEKLHNPELGSFRANLAFLSPTMLLIDVEGQQERSAQYYYSVNLETGESKLLYDNPNGLPNYQLYEVLDEQTIFARRWSMRSDSKDATVKFNLLTHKETVLDDATDLPLWELPPTQNGFFFSPGFNEGVRYRNIVEHTSITITTTGTVKGYTPDRRFVAVSYPYTDGGYNSERLEVLDTRDNLRRVIYDQHFSEKNTKEAPALKVGDTLSGFVSIEYAE